MDLDIVRSEPQGDRSTTRQPLWQGVDKITGTPQTMAIKYQIKLHNLFIAGLL